MVVFLGVVVTFSIIVFSTSLCRIKVSQKRNDSEIKRLLEQLKDEPGVRIELGGSEIAAIIAAREGKR